MKDPGFAEVRDLVAEGSLDAEEAAELSELLAEFLDNRLGLWVDLRVGDLADARRRAEQLAVTLAGDSHWAITFLEWQDDQTVRVGIDLGAADGEPSAAVRRAVDRTGLAGWAEPVQHGEWVTAAWVPAPVPQRGISRMELVAGPPHLTG
jgi:hypothetical protein